MQHITPLMEAYRLTNDVNVRVDKVMKDGMETAKLIFKKRIKDICESINLKKITDEIDKFLELDKM